MTYQGTSLWNSWTQEESLLGEEGNMLKNQFTKAWEPEMARHSTHLCGSYLWTSVISKACLYELVKTHLTQRLGDPYCEEAGKVKCPWGESDAQGREETLDSSASHTCVQTHRRANPATTSVWTVWTCFLYLLLPTWRAHTVQKEPRCAGISSCFRHLSWHKLAIQSKCS